MTTSIQCTWIQKASKIVHAIDEARLTNFSDPIIMDNVPTYASTQYILWVF